MDYEKETGNLKTAKLTDSQANHFLKQISLLRKIHKATSVFPPSIEKFITDNFNGLVGFLPFLQTRVEFGAPFERVVINRYVREDKKNSRLHNYHQIKYPPVNVAKNLPYNRANLPGQSVFYAGYGALATALETKPQTGDLYTTSCWQQKKGVGIIHIPIFHNLKLVLASPGYIDQWNDYSDMLGNLDKNVANLTKELYDFIATVFSTRVDPNNKKEYIFSALFADHFLNNKDFGVDALYYPSVPSKFSSSNIALKPSVLDKKFDLVEVKESICLSSPEPGAPGWMSHRTGMAVNIDQSKDRINWDNTPLSNYATEVIRKFEVSFE